MSNDVLSGSCNALAKVMMAPGNPIPLLFWCRNLHGGDPESFSKAQRIAVWCFYWAIVSMIVSCIVVASWISANNFAYGSGGLYAGFIWPTFLTFLWVWIAVLLCYTRSQIGLLIYAVIQAIWTVYGIWHCIEFLTFIAFYNDLGYSGGIWFVMFAVYVPAVFLSAALTFWIFKSYQELSSGAAQEGHNNNNNNKETNDADNAA